MNTLNMSETIDRLEKQQRDRLQLLNQARNLATLDWREGAPTIEAAHQQSIAISLVLIADALQSMNNEGIGVEALSKFTIT